MTGLISVVIHQLPEKGKELTIVCYSLTGSSITREGERTNYCMSQAQGADIGRHEVDLVLTHK